MGNIVSYVISNIGNVRDNHEDNFFIPKDCFISLEKQKEIKSNESNVEFEYAGENGVFVVCDGMGGHNAGEVASRLSVEYIQKEYVALLVNDKNKLIDFIKDLNNYICEYSEKNINCSDMGSTFSSLIFPDDKVYMLHVGDSRIYRYENNELKQISKDHTEGRRLVEAGIIGEKDLPKFPNRKSLFKYIGRNGELIADCKQIEYSKNTRFIIASDGLSDTLENNEIQSVVSMSKTPKEVCKNLIDKCLKEGNKCNDNVTIICIDIK